MGGVPGKFVVGDFTLQPMARTNHKFPRYGGWVFERKRKSTVNQRICIRTLYYDQFELTNEIFQ